MKDNKIRYGLLALAGLGVIMFMMRKGIADRVMSKLISQLGLILQNPTTIDTYVRGAITQNETALDLPGKSDRNGNSWYAWRFNDGSIVTFSNDGVNSSYAIACSLPDGKTPSNWSFRDGGSGKYTAEIVKGSIALFA